MKNYFLYYSPDTLLEGWTLRLDGWTLGLDGWTLAFEGWTLGLEGWTLAFDGWTPYLTDGHHTWRMDTLFDKWIFYFHELFICLIFSLLKEIPAFSNLYSFYCLTIIIYSFWNEGDYPVISNIIRSSSWVYSEEKNYLIMNQISICTKNLR